MKSPVASSSICTRSKAFGLNSQSKPSRVLSSAKRASRIRRATERSRRAFASVPSSRSRNWRCDKLSLSALERTSSSAAGSSGMPSVAQWLTHSSRSWPGVFVVVFFIRVGRFFQQRLILRCGARRHGRLAENLLNLLPSFGLERFPDRARTCFGRQDSFHRTPGERAIASGAFQRPRQVFAMVGGQQSQHPRGLILAAAPGAHQFFQEPSSLRSELGKALLQQFVFLPMILPGGVLRQTMLLSSDSGGIEWVPGDLADVGSVNNQFHLSDA